MLKALYSRNGLQLIIGLLIGICFGFLLHRGGVTHYDVIVGQLLLTDFTVLKIMLTAVLTGMIGIYLLKSLGYVQLHPKPGSIGTNVIGGLIFGAGFAILGYCPGTTAGAVGQGSIDALIGGIGGTIIGAGIFASVYGKIKDGILAKGDFGSITIPQILRVNEWIVVVPTAVCILAILIAFESAGF